MKTKKTREEFEEESEYWRKRGLKISLILVILFMLAIGLIYYLDGKVINKLETQLAECQDEVPVCDMKYGYWGFEVKCDYWDWRITDKHHYETYKECKESYHRWDEQENCEVFP